MVKKNLQILDFEDKKTNAGKRYTRFKTNEGWLSCFDTLSCTKLKEVESASVEVTTQGDFTNIKKYLGESEEIEAVKEEEVEVVKPGEVVKSSNLQQNKNATMYTSYAKDIFVALINNHNEKEKENNFENLTMEVAIELVKQAKTAFE